MAGSPAKPRFTNSWSENEPSGLIATAVPEPVGSTVARLPGLTTQVTAPVLRAELGAAALGFQTVANLPKAT